MSSAVYRGHSRGQEQRESCSFLSNLEQRTASLLYVTAYTFLFVAAFDQDLTAVTTLS